MEILIDRKYKKKNYTIGNVYINGEYFCDSLEDTDRGLRDDMDVSELRDMKVDERTAIPTGRYEIKITYSNRFGKMMPLVCDVKAFDGIRIHSGNTHEDTEGCILIGKNRAVSIVLDSRKTMHTFMKVLAETLKREKVWIEIK
jgi:hypothetical protein